MLTPETLDETQAGADTGALTTFRLDLEKGRIGGTLDGREAVRQAVQKCLMTERNGFLVYGDDYGLASKRLVGSDFLYASSELKRGMEEAIRLCPEVVSVGDFEFRQEGDALFATCRVSTNYGDFEAEVSA